MKGRCLPCGLCFTTCQMFRGRGHAHPTFCSIKSPLPGGGWGGAQLRPQAGSSTGSECRRGGCQTLHSCGLITSFGKALLRQLQQSISTTTRTITYDYDGLQRLTSAIESPGTNQSYSYDLAGNRTGVWVNGTRTQNYTYNAANQVTGWSYDNVGNLLNDGTTAYSYDALNRALTTGSSSNAYNADGTLVAQTQSSVTTRYTQDLAAPLSQILSDGTQRYVYGAPAERLYAQAGSAARTWYSVDALGSVRATLNDAGQPVAVASYDAWGVPETPLIGSFGFTGELQRGGDLWLRARWYGAGRGSFASRDPYAGDAQTPYSLMYYQYGYSNAVSHRDPSGQCIFAGVDTLICAGVAITIYEAIGLLIGAGLATYATYEACITQHGCDRLAIDIDNFLKHQQHTGHAQPPPADAQLPGTSMRQPQPEDTIQLGPNQNVGEVCTTEHFPLSGEPPRTQLSFPLPEEQGMMVLTASSDPNDYYTYSELRKLIKQSGLSGAGKGFEAHHLLEKKFAKLLGIVNDNDIISVPLTPGNHRNVGGMSSSNIDKLIDKELSNLGVTPSNAGIQEVWIAHRNVYIRLGVIEWADAIFTKYFQLKGVRYY